MYDCYGGYEVPNDSTDVLDGDSEQQGDLNGEEPPGAEASEVPVTQESEGN